MMLLPVEGSCTARGRGQSLQARLEDAAQCLLVIIGATPEGKKELVGLNDGVRESAQSWRELLLDLKRRGLAMGPELAVADGALGFWQAIEEVWPKARGERCWVHKTANVLNKLPKSLQSKAKRALQEIWMAETKKDALAAFDAFVETWGVKYDKAVECLIMSGICIAGPENEDSTKPSSSVYHLIPTCGVCDSPGDSRITGKVIQGGKRRVVCHGPSCSCADRLHCRRGSPVCETREGRRAGAPASGDRGRARRGLAGRRHEDRRDGSSDAAGLGDPVQRAGG
jgi:hypothetical protein